MSAEKPDLSAKPVARGFPGVICPHCGGGLNVYLPELLVRCEDCEWEMTPTELRDLARAYTALCDWLDLAPAID